MCSQTFESAFSPQNMTSNVFHFALVWCASCRESTDMNALTVMSLVVTDDASFVQVNH